MTTTISGAWLDETKYVQLTPLEQAMGFLVAEEIYDELTIRDQLIVDLMMAGWPQEAIGTLFGIGQSAVGMTIRRIRFVLANTVLAEASGPLVEHYRQDPKKPQPNDQISMSDLV